MKLLLVTGDPMQPYVGGFLKDCPHRIDTVFLPDLTPDAVRKMIKGGSGYEAILLPDGAAALDDAGLLCADTPIILPRVHNCASLLLGADVYRNLFNQYDGGICWYLPPDRRELYFSPPHDCSCLCYIADTTLGLSDDSVAARGIALHNELDFFSAESELSLLRRLMWGDWDDQSFLTATPDTTALPSFTRELVTAGGRDTQAF